jgi:hypothetical protein
MLRTGAQEARLVEAERARRTQTCRILDERLAVLAYRRHRGVPTDAELTRDLSDAVRVLTDASAD